MKTLVSLSVLFISFNAYCQADYSTLLEQRAKDFHQAISKNDKVVWKKYMTENFTTALIERPMRAQVSTSESDGTSTNSTSSQTQIDAKLSMFQQLHDDFGKSKISSITVTDKKIKMILNTDTGMKGVFSFETQSGTPWKIDKMGIEVEAEN